MLQKGQVIGLKIDELNLKGEGKGDLKGYPVFVIGALPGDEVTARIISAKKEYARAELSSVLNPSSLRVEAKCRVFGLCGGCSLQHLDYREQLAWKRQVIWQIFSKYDCLKEVIVHPTLGMGNPWKYRNKIQYPLGKIEGKAFFGLYAKRSHDLIPLEKCFIQSGIADEISQFILRRLGKYKLTTYEEETGKGLLRHIFIRVGQHTGEVMVVLVTTEKIDSLKGLAEEVREKFPQVVSFQQNINPSKGNVILGKETYLISGKESITDYIGGLAFKISPRSFFQVNPIQTEVLYRKALEYAGLSGKETVIDAYCGIGTISLFLARKAKQVIGIEVVKEAIENARENARLNGIKNVEFIVGDVTELIPQLYKQGVHPQVVVVDPPRKGCTEEVLKTFALMKPERIVYVSCNPVTLARDLAYLNDWGYKAVEAQPVDMFPQTVHVECVVLMSRL